MLDTGHVRGDHQPECQRLRATRGTSKQQHDGGKVQSADGTEREQQPGPQGQRLPLPVHGGELGQRSH
ncbi:hypothetical protein D3C87_2211750 [compost metagenome]